MKKVLIYKLMNIKAILLFTLCFSLMACSSQKNVRNKNYNKQWAIYNSGQIVNGKKGKQGIDINIQKTWKKTKGVKNIIVAVLDTGIDKTDPNIKKSIYKNKNEKLDGRDNDHNGYIDDISGWDFYHKNNTVYDDYISDAHGTYIANILAGSHQKDSYFGVAPGITILPVKILHGADGNLEDIPEAIDYAYNRGARIFNCSFDFEANNKAIYKKMKKYSDAVFVCAGGKAGVNLDKYPIYPACYQLKNIISVGVINSKGELYNASGYGKIIDIYAPGENIEVEIGKGDRTFVDGTSAATAYVSGAFALLKSIDSKISNDEIKDIIIKYSYSLENKKKEGIDINILNVDKASEKMKRR